MLLDSLLCDTPSYTEKKTCCFLLPQAVGDALIQKSPVPVPLLLASKVYVQTRLVQLADVRQAMKYMHRQTFR
jgi:hypothetical protein